MKALSAFIRSVVLTVAFCVASLAMSYAADRTISANYTLNADETVDGILTIADGVTVDLNGYNLTVKGLAGGGTIGAGAIDFTSPDPNEERVSYTTGSGDFYGGTKAINLFNDNYERQADDSHRVIIETKNLPLIVTYDFGSGSPRTIDMYRVFCGFYGNNTVNRRSPKSWTFEGSNDNENWATLDSRNSETNWSKEQETRTYTFTNTTAYRYYRITFTAANSTNNDYMELVQLEYLNSADCLSVPSELHVNVPANTFETNSTVTICGDVRLVKEGAGEFVVTKANQPYSGGNEVAAGTLKAEPRIIQLFGASGTDITVDSGATFDVNGSFYCYKYHLMMNGGTAANSGEPIDSGHAHLGNMTLTANSFLDSTHALGFQTVASLPLCIDLGGYVLDVTNGDGFRLMNVTVSNGTLRVSNADGQNRVYFNSAVTYANTATFDLQGLVGAYYDVEVSNLLFRAESQAHVSSSAIGIYKVYGTFKTETTDFPFVKMMDGSTLDLTSQNGTFNAVSTSANPNGLKLMFDTGATVTVDVSGRTFALGDCIVAWNEMPQNVAILFDATTATNGVTPVITERGIFYGYIANAVEWAWWTNAAHDGDLTNPVNWLCKNAHGDAVVNALPSNTTRVFLEGNMLNIQVPVNSPLTCDVCVLTNCTLAVDCDLRGVGAKLQLAERATIDLNGHRLYVSAPALTSNCTVKGADIDHVDDLTTPDASHVTSPTTFYINKMTAANLFNNNYVRSTSGTTKRVIVTTANLPLIVTYDFEESKVVDAYRIWTGPNYAKRLPMIWKFEGSNDNANWTPLDSRHAETAWPAENIHRTYTFDNTTAYRYYRITIEASQLNTDGYLELVQLEYFHLKPTRSELHIDTTLATETLELPGLTMSGNMRLFIEGTGSVRFTKTGQTYIGGTEICSGTVIPGSGTTSIENSDLFGEAGCEIVVRGNGSGTASASSALVDFGKRFGYTGYRYVLDGGTIQNSCGTVTELRLDAKSYMKATDHISKGDISWIGSTNASGTGYADLRGHELSVSASTGRKFGLSNATLENGSLYMRSGGWFITTNSVVATNNVTILIKAAPDIGGTVSMCNYAQLDTDLTYNMGETVIDVYGTFIPGAKGQFHGVTLHDGTTIDLSGLATALNAVSPFNTSNSTAQGVRTLYFEPDATIGVKLGERHVSGNTPVITWTAAEKPDATVTFKSADTGAMRPSFIVQDDGLYIVNPGFMLMIR